MGILLKVATLCVLCCRLRYYFFSGPLWSASFPRIFESVYILLRSHDKGYRSMWVDTMRCGSAPSVARQVQPQSSIPLLFFFRCFFLWPPWPGHGCLEARTHDRCCNVDPKK